jgi:hypothetical protein
MPEIHFTLPGLDTTLTMDVSGALLAAAPAALDVSATAIYYVRTSDMRKIFRFQTDSFDVNDADASDTKYYVFTDGDNWPATLKINPAHAAMSAGHMLATGLDASKNLVKHDFVRYLAKSLFNTVHGVDLFSNEHALLENIVAKGINVRTNIMTALDTVSASATTPALKSGPDISGNRYVTNALNGTNNVCRELIRQIANGDPARFYDLSLNAASLANTPFDHSVPLINGDSISFRVTIHAAAAQNALTSVAAIVPRTYAIKLILNADGTGNVVPSDTVGDNAAVYNTEYPT